MPETATIEERLARVEGRLEEQSRILANPATTDDIVRLEGRVKEDIAQLEARIKSDIAQLEARIRDDIVRLETRMKVDVDRLEARVDRLFYLVLGSWITLAIFIGGLYFR
jgi:hypothetical protein